LRDGDSVTTVANGVFDQDVAKTLLAQRYSADVLEKIRDAKIGIAGLGGIGSHIAESLVRAGFCNLVKSIFRIAFSVAVLAKSDDPVKPNTPIVTI
jgi:sulfur carrier protein ThiS adenylyltransferase